MEICGITISHSSYKKREKEKKKKFLLLEIKEIGISNEVNPSVFEEKYCSGKFKKRKITGTFYTVSGLICDKEEKPTNYFSHLEPWIYLKKQY